jgi:hypothetical protein
MRKHSYRIRVLVAIAATIGFNAPVFALPELEIGSHFAQDKAAHEVTAKSAVQAPAALSDEDDRLDDTSIAAD